MNQILPENLHPFFFFNGERIEKLAAVSQSHKVQEAIKNLMGLEIMQRASDHLQTRVRKYFNDKTRQSATEEIKKIIDAENQHNYDLVEFKSHLKQSSSNKVEYETELREVDENYLH